MMVQVAMILGEIDQHELSDDKIKLQIRVNMELWPNHSEDKNGLNLNLKSG